MNPPLFPDRDRLRASTLYVWEWLCRLDQIQDARTLLDHASYLLEDDPALLEARRQTDGMLSHCATPDAYAEHYGTQWEAGVPDTLLAIRHAAAFYPRTEWACRLLLAAGVRRVCDLGAGNGYLTLALAALGVETVGLNLTRAAVEQGNAVAGCLHLPAHFVLGHAESVGGGPFDAVCAFEIIEHVPDDVALVDAMTSAVNPGGLLLLTTPVGSTNYGHDAWAHLGHIPDTPQAHVRAYTERTFRRLFRRHEDVALTTQPAMRSADSPMVFALSCRRPLS